MIPTRTRTEAVVTPAADLPLGGSVREMLDMVLALALSGLPRASEVSVSLTSGHDALVRTVAATSAGARDLDAVQYEGRCGPILEAIGTARDVRGVLPGDRWPQLSAVAAAWGCHAVWSLPLTRSGSTTGALTVYAREGEPWTDPRSATTRLVAALAALELANAASAAQLAHGNATLEEALETRTVIGQAQGILMARESIGAADAFDILRRASQRTNRKLREIAAELVAGAGPAAGDDR